MKPINIFSMRLAITVLFLFRLTLTNSQTFLRAHISIKMDTISVPTYHPEKSTEYHTLFIKVNFGDFALANLSDVDVLKNTQIKNIDLVYSKFPVDEDLSGLNRKRIEYLHLACPSIFNNTMATWRIIAQTDGNTEYKARKLFHGFVITYKDAPTPKSTAMGIEYLKNVWEEKAPMYDSTVYKIFLRNKWKNMTVATDFTGSMAPYITQVLVWYKLTFLTKDFSEFIFFNDGDKKSDEEKRTGLTGGIYYCKSTNKDSVIQTAIRCTNNGYGGDIQENNIEACLFAIKRNPKLKEIIMIADNWAPMRDYILLSNIKIPVHIIICGVDPKIGINTQYLDLARHTKGSIHTMEDDISDLAKIAEGKSIVIGEITYRVISGRFIKSIHS